MDDYPLLDLFWTMLMFMFMILWILIVVSVFLDIFRRDDHGGWAKAMWTIFVVFLPVLGVFAYMITRPPMTEQDRRRMTEMHAYRQQAQGYSSVDEIAKARTLLDTGAITDDEFANIKRRALS